MESKVQSVATTAFAKIFDAWTGNDDVDYPLLSTSPALVRDDTGSAKKADLSWTPSSLPIGRKTKWPTFAVEMAWSERRHKIETDMVFWLCQSNGDVKAAMSTTVHSRGRISFEIWDLRRAPQGVNPFPFPSQRMEIVRNPAPNRPKIDGRIEIPYEDIYLQQKGANDTNFILTDEDVTKIAKKIWIVQFGLEEHRGSSSR
ncbi:hypothetical protein N7517_011278 [Penicillium concentricum]|uniref:Uncharacterized protein n=1 Tax=Penicillium concentricum TaxID=293559 RepID=A0A9W9RC93_9EURO|nr:uncharacterized protein N7517_011278 [Penicillium concentricum]KAJ5356669.1 hypothetical protein N7517_011278 [Penicillium concentricum]